MPRVNVDEIVNVALLGYDGDTSLISLSTASDPHREGSSENSAQECISKECKLVLVLDLSLVLPRPSFRSGHQFSESDCDPWVLEKLSVQPTIMRNDESPTSQGIRVPPFG